MDLSSIKLPTVRDLFIPDPGYIIFDVDLSGADAQVVAWESDEEELKNAFRTGLKIHSFNAVTLRPDLGPYERFNALRDSDRECSRLYKDVKVAVHATNYGAMPRTLSQTLGWSVKRSSDFQSAWFQRRPGILRWHKRTERNLQTSRAVSNRFGYRRVYFDRIETVFAQALAWVPQSTVGLVCARGDRALTDYFRREPGRGSILIQVHDSLVGQVRKRDAAQSFRAIHDLLHAIVIPYDDPLTIPWGLKLSDKSWGHCKEMKWKDVM